jgi:hypothetical protein
MLLPKSCLSLGLQTNIIGVMDTVFAESVSVRRNFQEGETCSEW